MSGNKMDITLIPATSCNSTNDVIDNPKIVSNGKNLVNKL